MASYIRRIRGHEAAQCGVNVYGDDEKIINFISYTTRVITATRRDSLNKTRVADVFEDADVLVKTPDGCIHGDDYVLECTGLYSPTTRKQIGYFLKEYFEDVTFQDIKMIAGERGVIVAKKTRR